MLAQCRAYIVANGAAQNRTLLKLAERAGFGTIGTVLGERAVAIETNPTDICFFFVHYRLPDAAKVAVLQRIRQSPEETLRYAPVVLVINDCPFETILKYVDFGFDDVVTLPENRDALIGELTSQLNTDHIYYETPTYLGPDRRRMEVDAGAHTERRTGEYPFSRLTIHREPGMGVRIVRREFHGARTGHENRGYMVPVHAPVIAGARF